MSLPLASNLLLTKALSMIDSVTEGTFPTSLHSRLLTFLVLGLVE